MPSAASPGADRTDGQNFKTFKTFVPPVGPGVVSNSFRGARQPVAGICAGGPKDLVRGPFEADDRETLQPLPLRNSEKG